MWICVDYEENRDGNIRLVTSFVSNMNGEPSPALQWNLLWRESLPLSGLAAMLSGKGALSGTISSGMVASNGYNRCHFAVLFPKALAASLRIGKSGN